MLLAITCFTLYDGLYFQHIQLDTKAEHYSNEYYEKTELPERRLVMLQVDSLGSDLVQMSKDDFVSNETTLLTLFYQLASEQPDQAILLPLQTSSPYNFYTGSALQTVLTGSLISSLGQLMPGPLQKDNILYHFYQKPREIKRALIFSGEAIEAERIQQYTHRVIKKPSFSFAAQDGFDLETEQHILNGFQLDSFDLFFG